MFTLFNSIRSGASVLKRSVSRTACCFAVTILVPLPQLSAELLVPAYANPCCGDGPEMWDTLIDIASSGVPVNVIINPASGPGASPIDPNFIGPDGTGPLLQLKEAGAKIFGYVKTTFGARDVTIVSVPPPVDPADTIEADINKYYDPAFYRGAGVLVDGIFFDEMANQLSKVSYYQMVRDLVIAKDPIARTIGNPGTAFVDKTNPTGTLLDYASMFDTVVTFEGQGTVYRDTSPTGYVEPEWVNDFGATHFAHIIHTEALQADMLADIALARDRNAGMIYITDDIGPLPDTNNPFDRLSSYFGSVVAAWVPEPTEFHVSKSGNDSTGDGSFGNPWATIEHALNQQNIGPGATLYIRGGTYGEKIEFPSSGAPGQPIIVRNYPGETVEIDGTLLPGPADGPLVLIEGQSHIRLQNISIVNWKTSVMGAVPIGVLITASDDRRVGCQSIDLLGLTIDGIEQTYDNGSNENDGGSFGSDAHGILVSGTGETEGAAIEDLLIEGCELRNLKLGTSEALVLNGNVKRFAIRSTQVHDCNNIGIDLIGFEGTAPEVPVGQAPVDQARRGLVADCEVFNISTEGNVGYRTGPSQYDFSSAGVYVDGGKDIVIERCRLYDNNIGCELASEHAGRATENITLRNSFIYRNTPFSGLSIGGKDFDPGAAGSAQGCSIVNNTLWQNDSDDPDVGFNGQIFMQFRVENSRFQNNIIVAHPATGVFVGQPICEPPCSANDNQLMNLSFDYNWYYNPGNETSVWYWRGSEQNNLQDWQTATAGEINSTAGTDPHFVSEAALDFHLQMGSPARNAGSVLGIDPGRFDVDGQARVADTMIDLGADEASAPVVLESTSIAIALEPLRVMVSTQPGVTYQLQRTETLNGASGWQNFSGERILGNGQIHNCKLPSSLLDSSASFFRVVIGHWSL